MTHSVSYEAITALFCAASHQYLYGVDCKADDSSAVTFAYIWSNDDPIHVQQEVVVHKLLQATCLVEELNSSYLENDASVPTPLNLFNYDTSVQPDQTRPGTDLVRSDI